MEKEIELLKRKINEAKTLEQYWRKNCCDGIASLFTHEIEIYNRIISVLNGNTEKRVANCAVISLDNPCAHNHGGKCKYAHECYFKQFT